MVERDPAVQKTESAVDPTGSTAGAAVAATGPSGADREAPQAIAPGDCLGRYTVRSLIGAGGMGQVFAASDNELGRTVALKVIRPDRGASSYARARLLREAQALALLHHPNVVTVHDVGSEGDHVFVAMELVEGPTLAAWMRAEPRSWRAIRDVFVAAGRGLAAAHAAGIVHRDFKPHNVIVGADRVVVVDFGLARAGDAPDPRDESSAPGSLSSSPPDGLALPLTLTGERVGTPSYMPPEQRAGEPVTARADQFAFCVALHEAVYGRRPSEPAVPGGERPVPRFVAAAIARGLSLRPEERWPSIDALLAAIGRTFWTRRRRRLAGVTAAALVLAIAALGFTAGRRAAAPPACGGDDAAIAPVWDDAARGRVRDAFRATGRTFADSAFGRVDTALRDRVAGWARTHHDHCEATHVRHEQSEAMLDLRAHCLDRSKAELAAFVALLEKADGRTVERAASAAGNIGDVARCSDPAELGAAIAPPPPAQVRDVDALREDTAKLSPLFELGKWNEALAQGKDVVERVRKVGYKPLLARALAQLAHVETNTGQYDAAIPDLYEVAQLGAEVGDDDVVAQVLPWLVFALGNGKERFDAADAVYRWAAAAVARAGNRPVRQVGLYGNRAVVLGRQGDHDGALKLYQTLVGLETTRSGPESLGVAWSLRSIGEELAATGHGHDAVGYYQRSAAMIEKQLGPDHPLVATVLSNYGSMLVDNFDYATAVPVLERSIAAYERTIGKDDFRVGVTVYGLGIAFLGQRRIPEARAALERALAINGAHGAEPDRDTAHYQEVLGDVAHKEGHPEVGHELAQKALAIKLKLLGSDHEEIATTYRLDADHLLALGRLKEARASIDKALALNEKARGKDHPEVGWSLVTQGDVMQAQHASRDALAAYERALAILDKAYAASPALCQPLDRLAAVLIDTGDAHRALEIAGREAALAANAPPGNAELAGVRLAQARWTLGTDRPAALAQARQARARIAALPFRVDELPAIDRWFAGK